MNHDASVFGPAVAEILSHPRVMPLGPGEPNEQARPLLAKLSIETVCTGHTIADVDMARCVLSGLWLYHDFPDESHTISQSIDTPSGAYWHGIMHRREPDYGNARYWFRRVGQHPTFATLQGELTVFKLAPKWDPFAFIDLCEIAPDKRGKTEARCLEIQMTEWWALLGYCYRQAING